MLNNFVARAPYLMVEIGALVDEGGGWSVVEDLWYVYTLYGLHLVALQFRSRIGLFCSTHKHVFFGRQSRTKIQSVHPVQIRRQSVLMFAALCCLAFNTRVRATTSRHIPPNLNSELMVRDFLTYCDSRYFAHLYHKYTLPRESVFNEELNPI